MDASARAASAVPLVDPAWLASSGMLVKAGEKDATYFYRWRPSLLTGKRRVFLQGVTPHMHTFGSRMRMRVMHPDGSSDCLLEIPRWHFGWEQPFWFAAPHVLEPEDALYLACHFDNSAENQPPGQAPSDIAWGGNSQDMCAAFVSFTES